MKNIESQVYRDLQKHLDKLPVGYPSTESGVEIRVLKRLFTPDEAKLATQLPWTPESLKLIHRRVKKTGMSQEELEQMLDSMYNKGLIKRRTEHGEKHYGNALLIPGIVECQVNRFTKDFVEDMEQYIDEAFAFEYIRTGISQMRTIPVEKSVAHEQLVSDYDSVRRIVDNMDGPFSVSNCGCRKRKDIKGEPCTQSDIRETCLQFGDWAEDFISAGVGRRISKDEVFDILDKAQEAGFVISPSNTQEPFGMCLCCGDCCALLSLLKNLPRPADFHVTNHFSEVDPALCSGCGDCVDRCLLDAMEMRNDTATVNLDRCIGCGNCVPICPTDAITLRKKEKELVPLKNEDELFANILAKKLEG